MIRNRLLTMAVVLAAIPSLSAAWSQEPSKSASSATGQPGLEVGAQAPKFTLKDQDGKERSLDEFLKKGKVALVFYRSADWCPFCKKQLAGLQADIQAIEGAGIQLVGISYDAPDKLKTFTDQTKITFPLLSDPGSQTIEAYHIRNAAAKGKTDGIPHPGTFLVDSSGVIRSKLFLDSYRDRHTTAALVKEAGSF